MNPALRAFFDLLATIPGARPAVLFVLVCVVFSPRVTAFMFGLFLATHMFWINP